MDPFFLSVLGFQTPLQVIWIDDTFTVEQQGSEQLYGYLLHDLLAAGNSPTPDQAVQALKTALESLGTTDKSILFALLDAALAKKLSLSLCDFAYAEKNWDQINKIENLLLIDIGHADTSLPKYDTYGAEFVIHKSGQGETVDAMYAFLTADVSRVLRAIVENKKWLREFPPAIPKRDAKGKPPAEILEILFDHFINSRGPGLRAIDPHNWKNLRAAICNEIKTRVGAGEVFVAHHMHGGGCENNNEDKSKESNFLNAVKSGVASVVPHLDLSLLPEYEWTGNDISGRVPLRALAQFDEHGRDIAKAIASLTNECSNSNVSVHQLGWDRLANQYLWFNVCALATGLNALAGSFTHELIKLGNSAIRGEIIWTATEHDDAERKGLEITVVQWLTLDFAKAVPSDAEWNKFGLFPLPKKSDATKTVKAAYDAFSVAGAEFADCEGRLKGVALRLFISAEEMSLCDSHKCWVVKCPANG